MSFNLSDAELLQVINYGAKRLQWENLSFDAQTAIIESGQQHNEDVEKNTPQSLTAVGAPQLPPDHTQQVPRFSNDEIVLIVKYSKGEKAWSDLNERLQKALKGAGVSIPKEAKAKKPKLTLENSPHLSLIHI